MKPFKINILLALACLMLCVGQVWGATYYIRSDGSTTTNCTGIVDAPYPGSGTGQACAWNSIAAASGSRGNDDVVLFRRGDTFADALLSITSTAAAGHEVRYGAYGTGAAPILSGSKLLATWTKTDEKTNVYQKTVGSGYVSYSFSNKLGVYEDWADMTGVSSVDICDGSPGTFYYDGSSILYIHTFESNAPSGHSIYAMNGGWGWRSSSASNWIIENIDFRCGQRRGFYIYGTSTNWSFRNCTFTRSEQGITVSGTANPNTGSIYNCNFVGNYGETISIDGTTGVVVAKNNIIVGNGSYAFGVGAGETIQYGNNVIYANGVSSVATGYKQNNGAGTFTDLGGNVLADPKLKNLGYKDKSVFVFTIDDSPNRPYVSSINTIFNSFGKHFTWYFGPTVNTASDSRWSSPSDTGSGTAEQWGVASTIIAAGHDVGNHGMNHQRLSTLSAGTGPTINESFYIGYVGAGAACTMTISGNTLSTTVDGSGDLSLNLTNASYNTIGELVAYIDALAGYTASNVATTEIYVESITLADISNQDIKTDSNGAAAGSYTVLFDSTRLVDQEIGDSATSPTKGAQLAFGVNSITNPTTYGYPYGFWNAEVAGLASARGFKSARTAQAISGSNIYYWTLSGLPLFSIPAEFRTATDTFKIDTAAEGTEHGNFLNVTTQSFPMIYTFLSHKANETSTDAVTSMVSTLIEKGVCIKSMDEAINSIRLSGNLSTDGLRVTRKIIPIYDFSMQSTSPARASGVPILTYAQWIAAGGDMAGKNPTGGTFSIGAYQFQLYKNNIIMWPFNRTLRQSKSTDAGSYVQ